MMLLPLILLMPVLRERHAMLLPCFERLLFMPQVSTLLPTMARSHEHIIHTP